MTKENCYKPPFPVNSSMEKTAGGHIESDISLAPRRVELLSPAGSFDTLKAVAAAGADAVYAAGARFGARAYAANLSQEELLLAIDYLHLHGKRLYLTVNTLLKEDELEKELYQYLLPLYLRGLDGVIIQDLGVLAFLKEFFPGMALHASTQMTITGAYGAKLLKNMGISRIVPARELSLEEIRHIKDQVDIEIESFIHGALCYCYSGQCLFSSMLGGRSGNRGRCAQPCRLPYDTKGAKGSYPFSMKDLCTIELLPRILESGVCSLKIEGRMKQAEYAAGVTSIYREYLDRLEEGSEKSYHVSQEDIKKLMELGSRSGFTTGYYLKHNGTDMMAMKKPAHEKTNQDLWKEIGSRFRNQELEEKIKGTLILIQEQPARLKLYWGEEEIEVLGDQVQKAENCPMDPGGIEKRMKKTGGSGFALEELKLQMEPGSFLPVGALNRLRREGLHALEEKRQKRYRRMEQAQIEQESGESEKEILSVTSDKPEESFAPDPPPKPYLAVQVQTVEQGRFLMDYPYIQRIYIDSGAFLRDSELKQLPGFAEELRRHGKKLFYRMPLVVRHDTARWYETYWDKKTISLMDGFVAGTLDTVGLLLRLGVPGEKILADSSLYVWNRKAKRALEELGISQFTLPIEANEGQLSHRGYQGGELLLYGYLPLMISAQCLRKNTQGCKKIPCLTEVTDRYKKVFPVQSQCRDCYNILYNSSPLSLLHQYKIVSGLKAFGYRISFTIEKRSQMEQILSYYEQGFLKQESLGQARYLKDYTNGHLKRGVE